VSRLSRRCTPLHAVNRAVSVSVLVFVECAVQTFAWKIALILLSLWRKNPKFLHCTQSQSLSIQFPSGSFRYTPIFFFFPNKWVLYRRSTPKIVLTFLMSTIHCIRSLSSVSVTTPRDVTKFPVMLFCSLKASYDRVPYIH
jgi:hypothetical protein